MEKIKEMLVSKDKELQKLGWQLCQEKYPAVWAALLNFTRGGTVTKDHVDMIEKNPYINIGTPVRYRGMEFAPSMVVINLQLSSQSGLSTTQVTAKYFNKGNQTFVSVTDRIECFEIIKKKEDES